MKVNDIKVYDEYMDSYILIENALFKAKNELYYDGDVICFELFNDLKGDIHTPDKALMNKINEMFTVVNNYRRSKNNNVEDFIDLIDDVLVESVKSRNTIYIDNNEFIEYVQESQKIADSLFNAYENEVNALQLNESYVAVGNGLININQSLMEGISEFMSKIKDSFSDKHSKIVERDGDWLKKNKDKLTKSNFKDVEIEVPSDTKSTFTNLINRHEIFDKNFKNVEGTYDEFYEKIKRFEDKNGNLKNGLDNYIRNGNSRREVSIKKYSGDEIKNVVVDMITYCEEFLSGKGFIESKLTSIMNEYEGSGEEIKESSLLYNINYDDLNRFSLQYLYEANEDDGVDPDKETDENMEKVKKKPVENEESKVNDKQKIFRDRQTGITVLMTIAEDRYFDYIELLKGL